MTGALRCAAVATLVALAGCGQPAAAPVTPLRAHVVEWNAAHAPLGKVDVVVDDGDEVVVFGEGATTVFSGGTVVEVDRSVGSWRSAARVPSADGTSSWFVGVDRSGRLLRLRSRSSFEPVGDRYGLGDDAVRAVAAFGGSYVGFLLPGELAVADGHKVTRYEHVSLDAICGGGGVAVGTDEGSARVFELATMRSYVAKFDHPRAAVTEHGGVYIASGRGLYGASPAGGGVDLRYRAPGPILALAASGDRVWFVADGELGLLERGSIERTRDARLGPSTRLFRAGDGEVWVLDGATVARYARGDAGVPTELARWQGAVRPVFARVCGGCHGPGGSAGVDLSTFAAWQRERAAIAERVVVDRSMPPSGVAFEDTDRRAIADWLRSPPK